MTGTVGETLARGMTEIETEDGVETIENTTVDREGGDVMVRHRIKE